MTNQPKTQKRQPILLGRLSATFLPLIIYISIALFFFGYRGSWSKNYFGVGGDPITFIWFLHWWPFAIAHDLNLFVSKYVWYPHGFNFTWDTSIPFAALVILPITLLKGPVIAFNLLSVMVPELSAWTAFLLARQITHDWRASLIGGYLFGFSSYELAQLLGHLNLDLTFLVPLAVLLCVRRFQGEISRRLFIATLATILLFELGLSTEVVATLCVLGAVSWALILASAPPDDRSQLMSLAVDIITAAAVMTVLATPFLLYLVKGSAEVPPVINSPTTYSADPLNYIIPTVVTRLGRTIFAPIADRFTGNASEQGAYLGFPLIFLVALYFRDHIGRPYVRALLLSMSLIAVLSLGPWLHIGGDRTGIPLPWLLAEQLPLIRSALPTRFTMYVSLCASIVVALYLSAPDAGRWRPWRYLLAALAGLFLAPNLRTYVWAAWPKQPFFTSTNVVHALGPNRNVIILPLGAFGPGMAWQLDAGMTFTQSGGYVGFTPKGETGWAALDDLSQNAVSPGFKNSVTAYCATHRVNYILVGPGTPASLISAINAFKWTEKFDHGIRIVRVPPSHKLKYSYIKGDYWPSPAKVNWMGRTAHVVTHGESAVLTLEGTGRPIRSPVRITLTDQSGQTSFVITQTSTKAIQLSPGTNMTVTASETFVPARIIHNGDHRHLSVLISLHPVTVRKSSS